VRHSREAKGNAKPERRQREANRRWCEQGAGQDDAS
jgi:hypothetical protein